MTGKPQISVAPMMDWTDRHCRYFHRLIAPHVRLYTEMVTTGALLHGDVDRHLRFSAQEHPLALQLGGSDPDSLKTCAIMAQDYGYDEINLNCGCPSDRVQKGRFGACLMAEPNLVGDCVATMQSVVKIPVTVKCRIGIDDVIEDDFLPQFIETVSKGGCATFIIHARKAWLEGLSPKENREVPPLRYDLVHAIKKMFPNLTIILNGGLTSLESITPHLPALDGVMIGREAYQNPWFLTELENTFLQVPTKRTREDIVHAMIPYIERETKENGVPVKSITRHMLGLFQGQPGAKAWKRYISEHAHLDNAAPNLLFDALAAMSPPPKIGNTQNTSES